MLCAGASERIAVERAHLGWIDAKLQGDAMNPALKPSVGKRGRVAFNVRRRRWRHTSPRIARRHPDRPRKGAGGFRRPPLTRGRHPAGEEPKLAGVLGAATPFIIGCPANARNKGPRAGSLMFDFSAAAEQIAAQDLATPRRVRTEPSASSCQSKLWGESRNLGIVRSKGDEVGGLGNRYAWRRPHRRQSARQLSGGDRRRQSAGARKNTAHFRLGLG